MKYGLILGINGCWYVVKLIRLDNGKLHEGETVTLGYTHNKDALAAKELLEEGEL